MEHRWGQRRNISKSVQLRTQGGSVALGRMLNVSLSGAFVQTSLKARPLAQVQLQIISSKRPRTTTQIDAQIIRLTETGLGLEWHEFGGEKILNFLAEHGDGLRELVTPVQVPTPHHYHFKPHSRS
jgi:hypothetical protein